MIFKAPPQFDVDVEDPFEQRAQLMRAGAPARHQSTPPRPQARTLRFIDELPLLSVPRPAAQF